MWSTMGVAETVDLTNLGIVRRAASNKECKQGVDLAGLLRVMPLRLLFAKALA